MRGYVAKVPLTKEMRHPSPRSVMYQRAAPSIYVHKAIAFKEGYAGAQ